MQIYNLAHDIDCFMGIKRTITKGRSPRKPEKTIFIKTIANFRDFDIYSSQFKVSIPSGQQSDQQHKV